MSFEYYFGSIGAWVLAVESFGFVVFVQVAVAFVAGQLAVVVVLAALAAGQLAVVVDLVPVVVDLVAYKEPHPCYLSSMTQLPLIIKLVVPLVK